MFWKVKLGCPGAVPGPGGEGAGACVPHSGVQAGAPRPPSTSPGQRAVAAVTLPGRTARPAPSSASPRVPLDTGVMDFRASETAFRRPFCPGSGSPSLILGRRQHPKAGDVLNAFLCGGPKSNSFDASNKIWVNWKRVRGWGVMPNERLSFVFTVLICGFLDIHGVSSGQSPSPASILVNTDFLKFQEQGLLGPAAQFFVRCHDDGTSG